MHILIPHAHTDAQMFSYPRYLEKPEIATVREMVYNFSHLADKFSVPDSSLHWESSICGLPVLVTLIICLLCRDST